MTYDISIIGAGPAGLMAGIRAGELGSKVLLIEKNKRPGLKLLTTGGGRCNITNAIFDPKEMAAKYGPNGKFLISALSKFGAQEVIDFFNNHGVFTKLEKVNQIFPESDRASEVLNSLISAFKSNGGRLITESVVRQIVSQGNQIEKIILNSGEEIIAKNYIIATGGATYPGTGSTGDAYVWLKKLGHKIVTLRPVLSPIIVKENSVKKLEGLSLEGVVLNLYEGDKKIQSVTGDIIFTASGVSGPAAHNLSRYIKGTEKLNLKIDFLPDYKPEELDEHLRDIFTRHGTKLFRNSLDGLVPSKLQYLLCDILNISADKTASVINREERKALINFLKSFNLKIQSVGGYDKAMVTAGGLTLSEVNPKNMQSKIIDNLFLAGEVLDLDGPSGGYNLQICWSTGYVAGEGAVS
ncbi:MAG: NAD(P)/FAD-dependent oxidoreductase [Candidatus Falkowbacteria bacterium]